MAGERLENGKPPVGKGSDTLFAVRGQWKSDCRMLQKAIREGWPMSDELVAKALKKLEEIISDADSQDRDVLAAIKTLVTADMVNVQRERNVIRREQPEAGTVNNTQINIVGDVDLGKLSVEELESLREIAAKHTPDSAQIEVSPSKGA